MGNHEAFKCAVGWYMASVLPGLRQMTFESRRILFDELQIISGENPLHMTGDQKFPIKHWQGGRELTGAHITALMVAGLWVQQGEDENMCSGLMRDWGFQIKSALILAPKPEGESQ